MTDRLANSNRTVFATTLGFGTRPGFRFSGDGRYLVYSTRASNGAPNVIYPPSVYVYDWQSGSNQLVSQSFYGPQAAGGRSDSPDISTDGRFIVYESDASDIVPSDNNSVKDIFLYDRQNGTTTLLSASSSGQGSASFESNNPRFTGNGQTVAFQSWAWDMTENDFNQGGDSFIVQIVSTNSLSGSTNPPPVFAGELIYAPTSGQSNPSLTWPVIPGAGYTVQFKDNLTDPSWQTVNGNVAIVGGQATITDFAPNPTNRFYRIVAY
jgi:Tol biopolymer transport system component